MAESTHRVEIVRLGPITKLENADSLGSTAVWGYQAVVRMADFKEGDLAAYVVPDSLVPVDRPEFSFLAPKAKSGVVRIRVSRLRGALSQGLLVHAPEGSKEGDDVAAILGVEHYEPPLALSTGGESERPPSGIRPYYDLESFNRFNAILQPGEPVVILEKVHGCCSSFTYQDDRWWCKSHSEWKKESEGNLWWRALRACEPLMVWLQAHPGMTVYGETYGQVQSLQYGVAKHEPPKIAVFDVLDAHGQWLDWGVVAAECVMLPLVPELYRGPFDVETFRVCAEGQSLIPGANNIREGAVCKTLTERTHPDIGRVALKLVSNQYLSR